MEKNMLAQMDYLEETLYEQYGPDFLEGLQDIAGIKKSLNKNNTERYFYLLLGSYNTMRWLSPQDQS